MKRKYETWHSTVTLLTTGSFREKEGYFAYRAHGTADWLLIYTLAGRGRFGHAGGELLAEPGDLVLLRPRTLHDYSVETTFRRWDFLWTHFVPRAHWLEWLHWPEEAPGLLRLRLQDHELRPQIEAQFHSVHEQATSALPRRELFAMAALETLLLWCEAANPLGEHSKLDVRVRTAMEFMCRQMHRAISLEELASHAGLSVSRLSHMFREELGTTPVRFLEDQRLARARQLLEHTNQPVKSIAYQVGFASPYYFSLRFKKATGRSPNQYRNSLSSTSPPHSCINAHQVVFRYNSNSSGGKVRRVCGNKTHAR